MGGVVIRAAEGCAVETSVLWDSIWKPLEGVADWAIASSAETGNVGGLRATSAIETAVTLALFTDKRVEPDHPLYYLCDGDPRGWWGDSVDVRDDLNETALGSHLWLLERAPLTVRGESITRWAEQFAKEALAPLADQGIVVRIEAEATANQLASRLELIVRLFGRDGSIVFDSKYEFYWNQVR